MYGWMDAWMHVCMYACMDGCMYVMYVMYVCHMCIHPISSDTIGIRNSYGSFGALMMASSFRGFATGFWGYRIH